LTIVINKEFSRSGEISRRQSRLAIERLPFSGRRWFDGPTLLTLHAAAFESYVNPNYIENQGKILLENKAENAVVKNAVMG